MTAKEKLRDLINNNPNWNTGALSLNYARQVKYRVLSGQNISNDKCAEILLSLGIKPKEQEKW